MKFLLHILGNDVPDELRKAIEFINRSQTIWRLEKQAEVINKPSEYEINENLSKVPSTHDQMLFNIGATKGRVNLDNKLAAIDLSERKALISEFDWFPVKEDNTPNEVFWAFAFANVCFQVSINSCASVNCIGFKDYDVKALNFKLLNLHICHECQEKIKKLHKYRLPEIINFVESLRKPRSYEELPIFSAPFLPTLDRQIRRHNEKPIFQDIGIVIIMHFLENLVSFIEGLMTLGAREESIALIVKPYPYAHRTAVHAFFYQHHPKIRIEYSDELPPQDALLTELVEHCREKPSSRKILVIEDGGYLVPFLHKQYAREDNFCIGAVEQTTKGIRKDEELQSSFEKRGQKLYFPVLNVAKSDFKDAYESPLVGLSVVNSIQKLLSDFHFPGKRALVVGFGAVGREVATALAQIGMQVRVYDKGLERIASAKVRGFETIKSPDEAVRGTTLIVGTTGQTSITDDMLEHIENGAILVSASSDRIEIDIEYLKRIAYQIRYVQGLGSFYKRKKEFGEDEYLLLADGFPVNFYFGSGISTRSIDPVLSQLFIGASHIAQNYDKIAPGITSKEFMNQLIKEVELLDDFINTYRD